MMETLGAHVTTTKSHPPAHSTDDEFNTKRLCPSIAFSCLVLLQSAFRKQILLSKSRTHAGVGNYFLLL